MRTLMKKGTPFLWIVLLAGIVLSCSTPPRDQANQQSIQSVTPRPAKPVIVILIDSLMDEPMRKAMQQGRVPALKHLYDHGRYFPHIVSSFPTMSVTIDSTLLTGTYADQHHVPGLVWYSDQEKRMIFYGYGPKEALKINQPQVVMDAVYQLNQVQLNKRTKTIHEQLAEQGKKSASINAIVFRGKTEHILRVPTLAAKGTSLPEQIKVTGPSLLSYAAFAQLDPKNSRNAQVWRKYGLNNTFSAQDLAFLVRHKKLPAFTIAYLPENDMTVHRKGPAEADGIVKADQALQEVLNAFGSWDQAVKQAVWVVMGDSAQSAVRDDRQEAKIDLRPLLQPYRIAKLSEPVSKEDQVVIMPNERMAYIYAIDSNIALPGLVKKLQREDKLDIIARKAGQDILVTAGNTTKTFSYRPGGKYIDEYGQSWHLKGNPELIDIDIRNKRIKYGKYPDVLARLYGAMHSHEGRYVVVTVKPGYELVGESSPTHIGGAAHGSLYEKDSLVPMLILGTDTRPKTLRIVDVKDWLLQLTK